MIKVQYDIDATDWARHLPAAIEAIDRWSTVQGKLQQDEHGVYYNLKVHVSEAKTDLREYRVLRPATLHLGAHKLLQDPHEFGHGWREHVTELLYAVAQPKQLFLRKPVSMATLDLLVQVALFRGEVLFP